MSTTGNFSSDDSNFEMEMRRVYYSIIDNIIGEMEKRFSERNIAIIEAVHALLPSNSDFLEECAIKSLMEISNLSTANVLSEAIVAKPLLQKHAANLINLSDILQFLLPYGEAFPDLYKLYISAATFGASTASCENSFSCLTRVFTPFRRTMTHTRKSNLVLLAAEKHRTSEIDLEIFMTKFKKQARHLVV